MPVSLYLLLSITFYSEVMSADDYKEGSPERPSPGTAVNFGNRLAQSHGSNSLERVEGQSSENTTRLTHQVFVEDQGSSGEEADAKRRSLTPSNPGLSSWTHKREAAKAKEHTTKSNKNKMYQSPSQSQSHDMSMRQGRVKPDNSAIDDLSPEHHTESIYNNAARSDQFSSVAEKKQTSVELVKQAKLDEMAKSIERMWGMMSRDSISKSDFAEVSD